MVNIIKRYCLNYIDGEPTDGVIVSRAIEVACQGWVWNRNSTLKMRVTQQEVSEALAEMLEK